MNKKSKRLMRKPEVLNISGIESNSTLYYLINKGSFPSPVKISERAVAWRESEVLDWIDSREIALQNNG
jgi:prophage regulatory protein